MRAITRRKPCARLARRGSVDAENGATISASRTIDTKSEPQHAGDRERFAIEYERLADHVCSPAETALPQPMRDEHDGLVLVGRLDRASQFHACAGDLEVFRRHPHALQPLGVARSGEIHAPSKDRDDPLQRATFRLEVAEIRQRQRLPVGAGPHDREGHQARRLAKRQRPHQDGVDQGEHRGVGADRHRQHRDDAGGECRLLPEPPHRLPQLLETHDRRLRTPAATMKLILFIGLMNRVHR